jgi:putative flippase GtrA
MKKTVGKFALVGSLNSILDLVLTYTLTTFAGIYPYWANFISIAICFVISFFANRHWTFQAGSKNLGYHMVSFTVVSLISGWGIQGLVVTFMGPPLNNLVGYLAIPVFDQITNSGYILAKLMAIGLGMIWNYLLYATVVFGATGDAIALKLRRKKDAEL